MIKIKYSSQFRKSIDNLNTKEILLFKKKEKLFREDPFHPSLKTHKLLGRLIGVWSLSVNYQYRVIFIFERKEEVTFLNIGTHDVYK